MTAAVLKIWGKVPSEKERLASVAIKSAKTKINNELHFLKESKYKVNIFSDPLDCKFRINHAKGERPLTDQKQDHVSSRA